ncbi:MAG: hypothetical protein WA160_05580 [Pseudobdellovibrio sp.]
MNQNKFVYALYNRVLWISDKVFHIPVLNDLYSIHLVDCIPNVEAKEYLNYTVISSHRFPQKELILNSIKDDGDLNEALLNYEKIKLFVRLCEFVNYSYLASTPNVFSDEHDKLDVLSQTVLDIRNFDAVATKKHLDFINTVFIEKKQKLIARYIDVVHQLKNATSISEVNEIGYKLVFAEIHVL